MLFCIVKHFFLVLKSFYRHRIHFKVLSSIYLVKSSYGKFVYYFTFTCHNRFPYYYTITYFYSACLSYIFGHAIARIIKRAKNVAYRHDTGRMQLQTQRSVAYSQIWIFLNPENKWTHILMELQSCRVYFTAWKHP